MYKLQNSAASAFAFSKVNQVGVYGRIESSRVRFNRTKTAIATSSCKSNLFRIWCVQIKSRCTKHFTKQNQASCSCKSLCSLFVFMLVRRPRRKRERWILGKAINNSKASQGAFLIVQNCPGDFSFFYFQFRTG